MEINLDNWEKLPTQAKIYYDDIYETIINAAGLGSGKTHGLCRKALKLSAINRGIPGGILAPDYSSYKKDIEPELMMIVEESLQMKEGKHFKYNRSEKTWRFCWSKAPVYVFTAERAIAGPNLGWGLVNEFSLIPYERIKEFLRRIRLKDVRIKQKILYGTPENIYGWIEEFIDSMAKQEEQTPGKFKIYHASTRENKFIDADYSNHLHSMLDSQALKVFEEGQIVRLGGNYFYYSFNASKNISENITRIPDHRVSVSMDFNVGRMTSTFWNVFGRFAHAFDELVLLGNSDTPEMGRAIIERFGTEVTLHIDASAKSRKTSGRSDLQILIDMGFKDIRYKSVNPTFRDRQLLVNGKIERLEIMVNPICKSLIKDLKVVKQLKSDYSKDKSIPELTHSSDGMDYLIDYCFPMDLNRKTKTIQL